MMWCEICDCEVVQSDVYINSDVYMCSECNDYDGIVEIGDEE